MAMYTPAQFKVNDFNNLADLIAKHPLGLLISHDHGGICTTPVPFLLKTNEGKPYLIAHISKANPHWKFLQWDSNCVVVFTGNHNYISPSWYPSKQTTHEVVPTWNYEIVEVRGQAIIHEDINWLINQVTELTEAMEKDRATPWKVSDAPSSYINSHIKGTIGIEITISEINGKWKMSQNKPIEEVAGLIKGLSDEQDPHSNDHVAKIMSEKNKQ